MPPNYFDSKEKQFVLNIFPDACLKVSSIPSPYDNVDLKYYHIINPIPTRDMRMCREYTDPYLIGHGDTEYAAWRHAEVCTLNFLKEILND
jgi:hypothetical protein